MEILADIPVSPDGWWWHALTSGRSLALLSVMGVSFAVIVLLLIAMARLGAAERARRKAGASPSFSRDGRATATIEFALVFPILLFFILILTQTTLTMSGNFFVHYAAFCATRTAIVQLPRITDDEPANTVTSADSPKIATIRASAAVALIPVAGRQSTDSVGGADEFAGALRSYFGSYGEKPPRWVDTLAADRYRYAMGNTSVKLLIVKADDNSATFESIPGYPYTFGPKDPITVEVTHKLNLAVPYISMIFADGRQPDSAGGNRYTNVAAHYILTNEGIVDALPPRPPILRSP